MAPTSDESSPNTDPVLAATEQRIDAALAKNGGRGASLSVAHLGPDAARQLVARFRAKGWDARLEHGALHLAHPAGRAGTGADRRDGPGGGQPRPERRPR